MTIDPPYLPIFHLSYASIIPLNPNSLEISLPDILSEYDIVVANTICKPKCVRQAVNMVKSNHKFKSYALKKYRIG